MHWPADSSCVDTRASIHSQARYYVYWQLLCDWRRILSVERDTRTDQWAGCLGCFGLFFVVLTVLYEWCQVVICLRIMPTDSNSSSYKIIIIVTRGRSNLTERPHRRVHKSCFTTRKTFNINSVKFTRLAHHYSLPVWRHRYLFKYLSCTVRLFKCRVGR